MLRYVFYNDTTSYVNPRKRTYSLLVWHFKNIWKSNMSQNVLFCKSYNILINRCIYILNNCYKMNCNNHGYV